MTVRYSKIVGYYICRQYKTCGGKSVRVDHVEAYVGELVQARLAELREELSREQESSERVTPKDFASQRARLALRRERFLEAYADGHVSRDGLREKLAKVDVELEGLAADEAAVGPPGRFSNTRARREALREVATLKQAWKRATGEIKRSLVALLAVRANIIMGHPPEIIWRSAEDLLANTSGA